MPTILYLTRPIIYLRTKKTGSHSIKDALKTYATENQISYLEVRSKPTDTLYTTRYVSHMHAIDLAERLDVWNDADKFTFIRNPWQSLFSYYYFIKYTGPKYQYNNPENYCTDTFEKFVCDLKSNHGSCNFNRPIYTIDNKIIADVYDVGDIETVMQKRFGITALKKLNAQQYVQESFETSDKIDNYIYEDYSWEIENFGYKRPLDQS